MATTPQVRAALQRAADALRPLVAEADDYPQIGGAVEVIDWAVQELRRRSYPGPRRRVSASATPERRQAIRDWAAANPWATQAEIAEQFRANSGRVSESLRGFRR